MSDVQELVERYIATWNEQDPARRRAAIDAIWTEDASYVDPMVVAEGRDAIDATIAAVRQQFPGLSFRLGGAVDAHHHLARFTWELAEGDGEAVVVGFDVAVLAEDGRLRTVHGFLDKVPA
ncbi:SnoaL-like domain-containing protein [Streptoalloteichus tenebrarius]|uniref:SnoaL-like domain-containing protein n=1 Tax=Streptoalloteichus tenebrarius (strain ATCC 17920 / DSM 40477 / JCM 4838 / CBS 697.72 / NBRC 16177 / NCIMB 11028 / NRRL B-12390 / A12253. 1 / ISP 5477) TaxID=1933 RepID=A0ABT1HRN1_STRSD|nr:nuclear transport factor 2 family protein [Streptoalloteichus tenebrarius]MCP2258181.1 SnoaL-like domain-containing protein [Streptoalloteichus tenebrarius]BFF04593.1 nuclear transport factor 2 family protein [Streptoalloteichus tenebrarius]